MKTYWKKMFSEKGNFDFLLALFCAIFANLSTIYFLIMHKEPIYLHRDEATWISQVLFCGGEFPFYEQKWGLIVPLLCLIYPLKYIVEPYYFPVLRIFFVFLDMYLFLRLLNLFFSKEISILIFLFYFSSVSPIFKLLKFLAGSLSEEDFLFYNYHYYIVRIFNPSFFLIFFLLFFIYFVRLLDLEEKQEKIEMKHILFPGIFLGLSFYSLTFWWIFLPPSVFFFLLYLRLFRKDKAKNVFKILILGTILGLPAILFNLYQQNILGESIQRGGVFVKLTKTGIKTESVIKFLKYIPEEYILILLLSFPYFVYSRFSKKHLFVSSVFLSIFLIISFESFSRIYFQSLMHLFAPFRIMAGIVMGFWLDKLKEVKNFSAKLCIILCVFMFVVFIMNHLTFFFKIKRFEDNISNIKSFKEIANWTQHNTTKKSVVTLDFPYDLHFFMIPDTQELMLYIFSGNFILHDIINYFSDFKDDEVFERFLLRSKLLGLSENELQNYIYYLLTKSMWTKVPHGIFILKAYLGEPPDFRFSNYKNTYEAVDDFLKITLEYFRDDKKFESLIQKYKVDYVVRRKSYNGEWYLKQEAKIGEFYVFKVIKDKR
jgi:hypothetical protein